jgi:hypothetical protein
MYAEELLQGRKRREELRLIRAITPGAPKLTSSVTQRCASNGCLRGAVHADWMLSASRILEAGLGAWGLVARWDGVRWGADVAMAPLARRAAEGEC